MTKIDLSQLDIIGTAKNEYNPQAQDGFIRIIQNWGQEQVEKFRINLRKNNSIATSQLYQSIEPTATATNFQVQMISYWKDVEFGQPKGVKPSYQDLFEWVSAKRELALKFKSIKGRYKFAVNVGKKIEKDGTEAKPFIAPVLTDATMQNLSNRLAEYVANTLYL
jgi:hypothetical protein